MKRFLYIFIVLLCSQVVWASKPIQIFVQLQAPQSPYLYEMFDKSVDSGRKGHVISKTSVRTATSVFATGKFLAKLPDMAIQMAAKMPKAKLWLRFKHLDDGLAKKLLKKLDDLPDGGHKFSDDFAHAPDETLRKFIDNPELVEAWKVMDDAKVPQTVKFNADKLTKVNRYLDNNPTKRDLFIDDLKKTSNPGKFVDRISWKDDLIQQYGDDIKQFKPQGLHINEVPQSIIDDMIDASIAPSELKLTIITEYIKSGSSLPIKKSFNAGDELYKIVPKGDKVTDFSPYWITKNELNKIRSLENIEQKLGLPLYSFSVEYDVYKIIAQQSGNIFESTIAPTLQNGFKTIGGATQSIVPNRNLWSSPLKIETFLP